jgi:hypothetical protein
MSHRLFLLFAPAAAQGKAGDRIQESEVRRKAEAVYGLSF